MPFLVYQSVRNMINLDDDYQEIDGVNALTSKTIKFFQINFIFQQKKGSNRIAKSLFALSKSYSQKFVLLANWIRALILNASKK